MEQIYDVVVVGGGLGGVAAALAAAKQKKRVLLTEETIWLGGQVTSQGVPPDEHTYIEEFGCTKTYREYRHRVRNYYRENYTLSNHGKKERNLNPGGGWVSTICHEPKVSKRVLEDMLSEVVSGGWLDIWYETTVVDAQMDDQKVANLTFQRRSETITVTADYFIDSTECGELLPLTNTAYVTGSESREQTGELHAPEQADSLDIQAVTWCFAVSLEAEGNYTIPKPKNYDYYKQHLSDFWPGSQLSWEYCEPHTLRTVKGSLKEEPDRINLFSYRQLLDPNKFETGSMQSPITLVNWPQNDYWLGPLYEQEEAENRKHYAQSKEISQAFLYWLQTEADGHGYPNLKPRGDVMGTSDGFAMRPYIRESRRIKAEFTVLEEHIGAEMRTSNQAEKFYDSVGIGHYHLDIHPSTGGRNYIDMESYPFQIPLGAMIPIATKNLIPGCKNIGTTHITNGCYRLHPVEWNIGEVAGLLAVYALEKGKTPKEIRQETKELQRFQDFLQIAGIELDWPKNLAKENVEW